MMPDVLKENGASIFRAADGDKVHNVNFSLLCKPKTAHKLIMFSYSSKWVRESGLTVLAAIIIILVDKLILAQLHTNCPFVLMKLKGSLPWRCPP
jgi:hypothetical protein